MGDRLRRLWDFDDLDVSEQRFRAQLAREVDDAGRAEVLTQLGRIEALRANFAAADELVDEAESLDSSNTRIPLERGRIRRSSGKPAEALPLFEDAFARATERGEDALAADAAHMAALVGDGEEWTARGVELSRASGDSDARYWLGPLYNNIGWTRYEAGDFAGALDAFERALAARADDPDKPYEVEIARYAVGKALRALGRAPEAVAALERALAWAEGAGRPDAYFHEELAEDYAAAGRPVEARVQAQLALALLDEAEDGERTARLRVLASALLS